MNWQAASDDSQGTAHAYRASLRSEAICLLVAQVTHHARQLLEKYFEKPFWPVPELPGMHLSRGEVLLGLDWLSGRFHLIRFDDNTMPSIDDILDKARIAVLR